MQREDFYDDTRSIAAEALERLSVWYYALGNNGCRGDSTLIRLVYYPDPPIGVFGRIRRQVLLA